MLTQRMSKSMQGRNQNKGYRNIPIRRSNNISSPSSSDSSLYFVKSDDNKYGKKWFAAKLQGWIGIILCFIIFLIFTIILYNLMPTAGSSLPPENITKHQQLHSTINDIISPKFNIDPLITDSIPKINPIQSLTSDTNNNVNGKLAIILFMTKDSNNNNNNNFCSFLLSVASTISSLRSSSSTNIDIVVFIDHQFEIDKLNWQKLANTMNFKLFKYQLMNGISIIHHIIKILLQMSYDSIIYLDHKSFVLRDPSILFKAISIEKYHFGAIWSFHKNDNNEYQQCLSSSMIIINLNHIRKYDVKYEEMLEEQPFCDLLSHLNYDQSSIDIDNKHLNKIEEISKKYGIVSLPWWYIMDYTQFKMYYHNEQESNLGINEMMTVIAHPQMVLSWLKYINIFQSKTHSQPIPFIIDLTAFQSNNDDDPFYDKWTSFYLKGIKFCSNLVS